MKKILLATLLAILFPVYLSNAQCGNDKAMQEEQLLMRTGMQSIGEMRSALSDAIENRKRARLSGGNDAYFTIPVVVHVLLRSEHLRQNNENPTDAHIISLIDQTNDLLRKSPGTAGDGNGVDTRIELCLASKDTSGNPTTGIVRQDASGINGYNTYGMYVSGPGPNNSSAIYNAFTWNNSKNGGLYLNVYIVWSFDNNVSGIGGLASYGVLIKSTEGAKTLVHEVGHWLGLSHTFEGGCTETDCSTGGDMICDTPPTTRSAATGFSNCNPPVNSCGYVPQIQNYMDYSPDICQNMFTAGQRDVMWGLLDMLSMFSAGPLATKENLIKTGCGTSAPAIGYVEVASFTNCVGTPISVAQRSDPDKYTSFSWDFIGGSPANSTAEKPVVTFATEGNYVLSLNLTNDWGTSTFTKNIQVVKQPTPSANGVIISPGTQASLSASGTGLKRWYLQSTPDAILHSGDNYTTPVLNNTTTYLVQSVDTSYRKYVGEAGITSSSYGNGGTIMKFDVLKELKLKAVTIYDVGLDYTILLKNPAGTILYTEHVPERGFISPPVKVRKVLNLTLPPGSNYTLEFPYDANADEGLGTTFAKNFPYTIPGYFNLKESNSFFSYGNFFNWEIEHEDFYCKSDKHPVTVTVQGATSISNGISKSVKIYPVPFDDHVTLETEGAGDIEVEVYDLMGQLLKTQEYKKGNTAEVTLSEFNQKSFYLKVKFNNTIEVVKIVRK